jgi:aldehyde dehydrogenase (NAD+)/coniferyl-aldehyde dehydrogenase
MVSRSIHPEMSPATNALQSAFWGMRAMSREKPPPGWHERQRTLRRLSAMLRENEAAIAEAVCADFGHRSAVETRFAELFPSLQAILHARRHLKRWMKPRKRGVSVWFKPASNAVIPQPLGIVGIVVPWNYPVYLAIGPLVAALSAGNRVMIKMSECVPRTGALLARLLEGALGPELVRVFNGSVELAEQFVGLPFDHVLFTGSTAVGRKVMRACAENLTPVTLELGGKSPVIVGPDADFRRAATSIVWGKMLNAGQTCVAPDYVLVPRGRRVDFAGALGVAANEAYPVLAGNPDLGAIVNAQHYARLQAWLEQARAGGATIRCINPDGADLSAERKIPLTLVWDCPPDSELMQQEIFGPVLPLLEYDSIGQAIEFVNSRPRPLALYLFSDDAAVQRRIVGETVSGGVALNETVLQVAQDDLPFGGVGASGMGHYHGYEGFLTFSKLKPVFRQRRLNGLTLFRPPYGRSVALLLRWMLRR